MSKRTQLFSKQKRVLIVFILVLILGIFSIELRSLISIHAHAGFDTLQESTSKSFTINTLPAHDATKNPYIYSNHIKTEKVNEYHRNTNDAKFKSFATKQESCLLDKDNCNGLFEYSKGDIHTAMINKHMSNMIWIPDKISNILLDNIENPSRNKFDLKNSSVFECTYQGWKNMDLWYHSKYNEDIHLFLNIFQYYYSLPGMLSSNSNTKNNFWDKISWRNHFTHDQITNFDSIQFNKSFQFFSNSYNFNINHDQFGNFAQFSENKINQNENSLHININREQQTTTSLNYINKKFDTQANYNYFDFNFTFLELGACDGLQDGISYFFETCLGWKGYLIDANPVIFPKLKQNRPKSDKILLAPSCMTDNQTVNITGSYGADAGLTKYRVNPSNAQTFSVHCGPLQMYLNDLKVKHIDLFVLDVEGSELTVLNTLDWKNINKYDQITGEPLEGTMTIDFFMIEVWNRQCGKYCKKRDDNRELMFNLGYNIIVGLSKSSDVWIHPQSRYCQLFKYRFEMIGYFCTHNTTVRMDGMDVQSWTEFVFQRSVA